ncbi:keratin-associated protein 4-3-like [Amphibalanus amphitrite]|uniref:keratin-associated protein 4-3-like n=1 Tax=Amphibalanus amphitrite TaxID=1232801 RepID=UPI001C91B628|nr:keratin-associated protein 4-3-like [Amphibalanus amphitrite]
MVALATALSWLMDHPEEDPGDPPPPPSRPPSCQAIRCAGTQVCVLQEVVCATQHCYPVPVCIDDPCALALCGQPGTRCVTQRRPDAQPACTPFPGCQFTSACVPRARPKPGFCPAASLVPADSVKPCTYDNDCPSSLLCCRGASGSSSCTAPAFPNPCDSVTCGPAGPTCRVVDGVAGCLDRVCSPGPDSYFCQNNTQTFCSQSAAIIRTDLPC